MSLKCDNAVPYITQSATKASQTSQPRETKMEKIKRYEELRRELDNGEITQKGFDARVKTLLSSAQREGTAQVFKADTSAESRDAMIASLFQKGLKQREILGMLMSNGVKISARHLRRLLKELGLRRRGLQRPFFEIQKAVESEMKKGSPDQGIRAILQRVRDVRGIQPCYRGDVADAMRNLDASGLRRRYPGQKKIPRRNYISRGPNDTWHIDGNDKLKFFGLWIHLCIDGFSRKVIWLKVGISNRRPAFVGRYFYDAVVEQGGCPSLIRGDRGKENLVVGEMQVAFHLRRLGNRAKECFRMGKSVHNQRAEFFNSVLKKTWIKKWLSTFETMMSNNILELDNPVHINCLQYTYLPLLQEDLKTEQMMWNNHSIRKQRKAPGPFGKPDVLYSSPPPGYTNMLWSVDADLLAHAAESICESGAPLTVANQPFRDICGSILRGKPFPCSADECLAAYVQLIVQFATAMDTHAISLPTTFAEANDIYTFLHAEMGGQ
ncbi:uncharacterized protein LOC121638921 isoform X1 [Melanotaenia boesemani]|uniref:uncharacterized protein LOC121638921 isoform X1 n=2 Tax=Melanotaenia boesemani TaxID=1250792 RepID=UPI001C03BEDC|nr:uncharacterized protein LOC121638921 isoform X1 [Melanotaenia boesemani]